MSEPEPAAAPVVEGGEREVRGPETTYARLRLALRILASIVAAAGAILPASEPFEDRLTGLGVAALLLVLAGGASLLTDPEEPEDSQRSRRIVLRLAPFYVPAPLFYILLFPEIAGRGFLFILVLVQIGLLAFSAIPSIRRLVIVNGALLIVGALVLSDESFAAAIAWLVLVLCEMAVQRFEEAKQAWQPQARDAVRPPLATALVASVAAAGVALAAWAILPDLPGFIPRNQAVLEGPRPVRPVTLEDAGYIVLLIVCVLGTFWLFRQLLERTRRSKGAEDLDRLAGGTFRPLAKARKREPVPGIEPYRARIYALYERFAETLAGRGLARAEHETPTEHALRVAERLESADDRRRPRRVDDVFSRARYDDGPVGPDDVRSMEESVDVVLERVGRRGAPAAGPPGRHPAGDAP